MLVRIRYTAATGEKLINVTFGPKNIRRRVAGTEELHEVEIRNGRSSVTQFSLDENGFVLVQHRTAVRDFFDKAELERVYYPEVSELIRSVSGAARVIVFDHTLRSGEEAERDARGIREPLSSAHNDYTEWSGPNRVRELMGEEAETLTCRLKYSPEHRWFYFPQMGRDEALVFKVFDSETDGRARFTPHASFDDPSTPLGAPPRQSIEARALAFF